MPAVLFVCLGNICRSPTVEGLFRHHVAQAGLGDEFLIDSAGTGDWHAGSPPDPRAIATASRRGVSIVDLRARQITEPDFRRFDLILGMDRQNVANIARLKPADATAEVRLFLDAGLGLNRDVPDPYHEDQTAFETVFDLCDQGAAALLARLRERAG